MFLGQSYLRGSCDSLLGVSSWSVGVCNSLARW
jgi:hypothetical protein